MAIRIDMPRGVPVSTACDARLPDWDWVAWGVILSWARAALTKGTGDQ